MIGQGLDPDKALPEKYKIKPNRYDMAIMYKNISSPFYQYWWTSCISKVTNGHKCQHILTTSFSSISQVLHFILSLFLFLLGGGEQMTGTMPNLMVYYSILYWKNNTNPKITTESKSGRKSETHASSWQTSVSGNTSTTFCNFGQGLNQKFWLELKSQILQERKKKTMCGATPVHNLIRKETK